MNIKKYWIEIKNKTQSRDVQKRLFELGYEWVSYGKKIINLPSPNGEHLVINIDGKLLVCGTSTYAETRRERKKVTIDELESIYKSDIEKTDSLSKQVGGNHYKDFPIQPVEFIYKNKIGYLEGNIIKYASRHKNKNGKQDLEKVIHYAQLLIDLEYGEDDA